jgi:hypothetical protein
MREYADPVIDWLDQGRGLIEGRLFREVSLPSILWFSILLTEQNKNKHHFYWRKNGPFAE